MDLRAMPNRTFHYLLGMVLSAVLVASCAAPGNLPARAERELAKVQLPSSAREAFDKYETTILVDFRAFAVNPTTGRWGRSWHSATPKQAMDEAINTCEKTGEKCTLYALGETVVSGMSPADLTSVAEAYYSAVSPAMSQRGESRLIGDRMPSGVLVAELSNRRVVGMNYNGLEYRGIWLSDGTMRAESTQLNQIERIHADVGTWTVENGRLCRQWQHWSGGRRECLLATRERDTIRAYDVHGDVIELITLLDRSLVSPAAIKCVTKTCIKTILDQVLFVESWRTPDRTKWLARRDQEYKLISVSAGVVSLDGIQLVDPNLQFIAVAALTRILGRQKFPMFSNVGVKIDRNWTSVNQYIDVDTFQMLVLEPEMFEAFFSWDWQNEMGGPIKDYISRGCFYSNEIWLDHTLIGAQVVMNSTLSEAAIEDCIEDAIYHALGLVDERHPSRDIALQILYNSVVRSGMTRVELFELIDSGVVTVAE